MTRFLVLLALALTLLGCAVPVTPTPQSTAAGDGASGPGTEGVIAAPVAVSIPAIGAESTLIPLGLDLVDALSVPPLDQPLQAGWYEPGVIPGQAGPAVIAAHVSGRVDGQKVPGLFARLSELEPGDEVIVERFDAAPLTWRVVAVDQYPKDRFPTAEVYGDTDGPELKLITCGGEFDPEERSYRDNVVVTAVLA